MTDFSLEFYVKNEEGYLVIFYFVFDYYYLIAADENWNIIHFKTIIQLQTGEMSKMNIVHGPLPQTCNFLKASKMEI